MWSPGNRRELTALHCLPLSASICLMAGGVWASGWAEDMPEPPGLLVIFPNLIPTQSVAPAVRTRRNVHDSDATLILHPGAGCSSPGSAFVGVFARCLSRPFMVAHLDSPGGVTQWLRTLPDDAALNVACPRQTDAPGSYEAALKVLLCVLVPPAPDGRGRPII